MDNGFASSPVLTVTRHQGTWYQGFARELPGRDHA